MRWSTRFGMAATAAAVLVGGFVAPANAAPPVSPPPLELAQSSSPDQDSLTAYWGLLQPPIGGFVVANETTELHVVLPDDLADHFGDHWSYSLTNPLAAEAVVASGVVPDASGTFTVGVPQSLKDYSELRLGVSTGQQPSTGPLVISLDASIHVRAGESSPFATVTLARTSAFDWAHSVDFGATPQGETVSPGSMVTITSPAGTWISGPDGDWWSRSAITASLSSADHLQTLASVAATASADGSTITFQIPSAALLGYWPYFPGDATSRDVDLSVSMLEKGVVGETLVGGSIRLHAPLTLVPAAKPATDRVSGEDRYAGAIAVSQQAFPEGAATAFVATGENYPDALSAAPAAVHRKGPLLLTTSGSLLPAVETELERLQVKDVYVVGGVNSISDAVVSQIRGIGATVHRLAGADRLATSRAIATDAFGGDQGSGIVYVATGTNFPDALAAGGAAGHLNAPVLLVDGSAPTLDLATKYELTTLGVTTIRIAGGTDAVSAGIEHDLGAIAATIRLTGADRIDTAAAINLSAYGASDRAFLATGYQFPDALSGSAWAGRLGVPLYVSRPDCLPSAVADAVAREGVTSVTLLGGAQALAPAVQDYTLCAVQ